MSRGRWPTPAEAQVAERERLVRQAELLGLAEGLERASDWRDLHARNAEGRRALAAATLAYREHLTTRGERWSQTYHARLDLRWAERSEAESEGAAEAVAIIRQLRVAEARAQLSESEQRAMWGDR